MARARQEGQGLHTIIPEDPEKGKNGNCHYFPYAGGYLLLKQIV